MFKFKVLLIMAAETYNPDNMGGRLYDKALQFGKWFAILALVFVAFLYFMNKQDRASQHFWSIVKGVFVLILAPTIIGILIWIAGGLKL